MTQNSEYQIDHKPGALFVRITDHEGGQITISLLELPSLLDDLLRLLYPGMPPRENHVIAAPDTNYDALCELGKEWQRPTGRRRGGQRQDEMHRIYFDPLQGWYGLLILLSADGSRQTTFRGQPCTEDEARAIIARFVGAKVYFDVIGKAFHGTEIGRADFEFIVEQIRTLERGIE